MFLTGLIIIIIVFGKDLNQKIIQFFHQLGI